MDTANTISTGTWGDPNPHTGPFETRPASKRARHQPICGECETNAADIAWKDDTRDSDTWHYLECEKCETALCRECGDDTDTGMLCICCLSGGVE